MSGNSTGNLFCVSAFGESHGPAIGGVIDGCPSEIMVDYDLIKRQLSARHNDPLAINKRREPDEVEFLSGIMDGKTTGTPVAFLIRNKDIETRDYPQEDSLLLKPSHGHFSYWKKYGVFDYRGGGRASARETACRVVAGCFAEMYLRQFNITTEAFTVQTGKIKSELPFDDCNSEQANENPLHCPDNAAAERMLSLLEETNRANDTVGCIVGCVIRNLPAGLGEPVFDKLSAELAKAMLSINAAKGFEYGSGFASAGKKGSELNDLFLSDFRTKTNFSGGIQAGISNGNPVYFSVAFKPLPSIGQDQPSINTNGNPGLLKAGNRHDICAVPRVLPVVEAMAAITIVDHLLRNNAYRTK
ncbi:MAG: chorismate synthase [Bacteroidales bacterium]|jgi:chorismate synthase|nr:chorismate synthase [Bacteroidales bacterium]